MENREVGVLQMGKEQSQKGEQRRCVGRVKMLCAVGPTPDREATSTHCKCVCIETKVKRRKPTLSADISGDWPGSAMGWTEDRR